MKKVLSCFLVCLFSFSTMGCNISEPVQQTNQSLTVSYYGQQFDTVYDDIRLAEMEFRRRYPDVELTIERIPYSATDDKGESFYKQMATEIMAGKGPDVFWLAPEFVDVNKMMKSGTLADMTELMENDPEFDVSGYQKTVLDGGRYNGRQYTVPLTYTIPALLSEKSILKKAGINPNDLNTFGKLWDTLDSYTMEKYRLNHDLPRTVQYADRLRDFPDAMGLGWINLEEESVDLSDAKIEYAFGVYKNIYQNVEERASDHNKNIYGDVFGANALIEHSILFEPHFGWKAYDQMMFEALAVAGSGEPVFIPIYDYDGTIQAEIATAMAVRRNSPNQKNSWNLIKILLEREQMNAFSNIGRAENIPVCEEAFDFSLSVYEKGLDPNGLYTFGSVGRLHKYGPVPKEFIDAYREATTKVSRAYYRSNIALDKLYEGFASYLKGEKGYEASKELAESNVLIYVSE